MRDHDGATYLKCNRCGTFVIEGEWGAHECPQELVPIEEKDIPKDILDLIKADKELISCALDDAVIEIKTGDAADVNNGGPIDQIDFLIREAGLTWDALREHLGIKLHGRLR